jgi:hypothetical protein
MRACPSESGDFIMCLRQYDNLTIIRADSTNGLWYFVEVENGDMKGYVDARYVKPGIASVRISQFRTGAVCKDGCMSDDTGDRACIHHGGVESWKYAIVETISIE